MRLTMRCALLGLCGDRKPTVTRDSVFERLQTLRTTTGVTPCGSSTRSTTTRTPIGIALAILQRHSLSNLTNSGLSRHRLIVNLMTNRRAITLG
jgi:hypothetical protein